MEWHQDATEFAAQHGIPREVVESAALNPTHTSIDPTSAERGYAIERRRRGDVEAIVGLLSPDNPMILFVRVITPDPQQGRRYTTAAGSGRGSTAPNTMRELRRRLIAYPAYSIVSGGRHDKLVREDGSVAMTLPKTPSDNRSIPNAWAEFQRVLSADAAKNYQAPQTQETPDQ